MRIGLVMFTIPKTTPPRVVKTRDGKPHVEDATMIQDTTSAPVVHIQPAEASSSFISGLKQMSDRLESLREKARVAGLPVPAGFIGSWQEAQINKAFAEHEAEQARQQLFTEAEAAEYAAYSDSVADELAEGVAGGIETVEEADVFSAVLGYDPVYADLDAASVSPLTVAEEEPIPSRTFRPADRRGYAYRDSDGNSYTQW